MTCSSLVVADTTPLDDLTLIGQVHILGFLFEKVLVPGVFLQNSDTRKHRRLWRSGVKAFPNGSK